MLGLLLLLAELSLLGGRSLVLPPGFEEVVKMRLLTPDPACCIPVDWDFLSADVLLAVGILPGILETGNLLGIVFDLGLFILGMVDFLTMFEVGVDERTVAVGFLGLIVTVVFCCGVLGGTVLDAGEDNFEVGNFIDIIGFAKPDLAAGSLWK